MSVYIHKIATSVPPQAYEQGFLRERMKSAFPGERHTQAIIHRVYNQSGIERRYSVVDDLTAEPTRHFFFMPDGSVASPSTAERNRRFTEYAPRLIADVGRQLVGALPDCKAEDVTHVVTVSCTGFFAPGPAYVAVRELGLSPRTKRLHIGFMGCFAAFQGLQVARSICVEDPDAVVLMICLELCTLHLHFSRDPDALVSGALFADGAAGALVSARTPVPGGRVYRLEQFATAISPNSENDMAWTIGDEGFDLVLSQYVPAVLESNVRESLAPLLASCGVDFADVGLWAVHPGGRAILEKIQSGLELEPAQLEASRSVLRDYGNMSSATILFVLDKMLGDADEEDDKLVLAMAFGPGLTIESALLTQLRA